MACRTLSGKLPYSWAELFPYLDSRNIDFVGYSREQYERTKALPEGSYRISFTAYDYRRQDVQVSNEGSSFYYLSKNEPPMINLPVCGAKVPVRQPQQLIFSWLPRNTSSPASAGETQYEFSLYEIRPEGRNPNDVVLSSQPVFKTTIDYTQLVYGPAEPQLIENMRYVWRVRAIDTQGRDAFRNNGYSEVCSFTYGGIDPTFIVGGIEGLQAEGESERSSRIWWEKGSFDSYRIYYKKSGEGHEWFTSDLLAKDLDPAKEEGELKLFDLEPDTEYETRAQAYKMGNPGPYTEIIKYRTLPVRVAHCGDPALLPEGGPGEPYREAIKGMTIEVDGMEMTLLDAAHLGDGYYQGLGRVSVDYLAGATFTASFDRIFINTDRQVVLGRIDFITNGVAVMAEEQLAEQNDREKERIKEANRQEWAGTDFYGQIFLFDNIIIEDVSVNEQNINITDSEGNIHPNTEVAAILAANPGKAIIIEEKNGDQWVVDKDGKVSKVDGGGLSGGENGSDTIAENLTLQEKLIVEVLEEFGQELETWLNTYGKGPLSIEEMLALIALPECFPENEIDISYLSDQVIPDAKELPGNLLEKIESQQERKNFIASVIEPFKANNQIDKESIDQADWDELRSITCNAIMEGYESSDAFTYYVEQQEGRSVSNLSCWPEAVARYTKFYLKFDSDLAFQAGMISYLICATSYDNNSTEKGAAAFTLGFSNALLQELDWFALIELANDVSGITEDDAKELLGCIVTSYQLGVDPEHSELSDVAFKCLTGITIEDMQAAIKDFIADNWNEPYYQGQATAFTLTLLSPFKGKILEKVKKLPKFSKSLTKLNKLAIAKNKDELVTIARSLLGKKLAFSPSWLPGRTITGNLDNPKGLVGVYNKPLPGGKVIDDTKRALEDLDFPETFASNYTTASKDGFKMLNTNEWYYKMDEPAFWDDFNKPWLDKLTSDGADIVVLSDKGNDLLKYQWKLEGDKVNYILDDDLQKVMTGFGKEIDYLENLVKDGKYIWDDVNGVYKATGN